MGKAGSNFLGCPSFLSPGGFSFVSLAVATSAWSGPSPLSGVFPCDQEWVVSGAHLCVHLCESDLPVLWA